MEHTPLFLLAKKNDRQVKLNYLEALLDELGGCEELEHPDSLLAPPDS